MNINWAEQHDLTWRMFSSIQDSPIFLQAFGFDTGSENVNSGGKQIAELYRELARKVLIEDIDGTWAVADITKLGTAARNRINVLKKRYGALRKQLGDTGHGLIDTDMEDSITAGSTISNVWDKIQVDFPWYKELNKMLRTSPVYVKDAASNSDSPVDVSVLGMVVKRRGKGRKHTGEDEGEYIIEEEEEENVISSEIGQLDSDGERAAVNKISDGEEDQVEGQMGFPGFDTPKSALAEGAKSASTNTPNITRKSRPTILDRAAEIAQAQRVSYAENLHKNNIAREKRKRMEGDTAIKLRKLELDHQMSMMKMRLEITHQHALELARLQLVLGSRAGALATTSILGSQSTSSPTSLGDPQGQEIDFSQLSSLGDPQDQENIFSQFSTNSALDTTYDFGSEASFGNHRL
ncbi:hypothetical protein M422DRAFT_45526 [Sphaerobolus stellatus SS14]|uniref:Uncharacterized protein n=1 Tax=Sphaerobolus stellatus (strain SS14) TaxID=990650 RepID=A0A0C9W516_SPHS4|nr:hypothetical protein M422DRAFT_45526 [Sphaerobolus stellatus SS14]